MVKIATTMNGVIDLIIMPSLRCNLKCEHCMYKAGPNKFDTINIEQLERFVDTIDWDKINSCGFYGGEPSIEKPLYKEVMGLIPINIPIWLITNGTWSRNEFSYREFLDWAYSHGVQKVFISTTPFHTKHQDLKVLQHLVNETDWIEFKSDDTAETHKLLPMGRAHYSEWTCTQKCLHTVPPLRYAVMPNGDIVNQNCDGVHPVVGNYYNTLNEILQANIECRYI